MKALRLTAAGLLGALVLAAVAVGLLGWHQGYRAYAVRTGSMAPTYPTGALVVDRPVRGGTPTVGDVITFPTRQGLVTHRVHAVTAQGIQTKGDANATADTWYVDPERVVGTVAWGASRLGYVFVFFQQPTGAPSIVLLGLSVWLAWTLFFPAKETAEDATTAPDAVPAVGPLAEPVRVREPVRAGELVSVGEPASLIVLPGADEPSVAVLSSADEPSATMLPARLPGARSRSGQHLRSA